MVQKIHPWGVIWVPDFSLLVERFQIRKLLSKCSILEPSLGKHTAWTAKSTDFAYFHMPTT